MAVNILQLPGIDLANVADILEWLFLIILPSFSFGQGIADMYGNLEYTKVCAKYEKLSPLSVICEKRPNICCIGQGTGCGIDQKGVAVDCLRWTKNYMAWDKPGLGRYFTFMPLQFLVLFGLVFLYELGLLRKAFYTIKSFISRPLNEHTIINMKQKEEEDLFGDIPKDSDVLEEENRIKKDKHDLLSIDNLTKYYGQFMAVKGISVGIQPGECFGLLG